MTDYRTNVPPPSRTVQLKAHDRKKLMLGVFGVLGGWFVLMSVGVVIAINVAESPFVMLAVVLFFAIGFFFALFGTISWLHELRFLLEFDAAQIRLRTPPGVMVADTTSGALTFTRVTYTRHGRYGAAWTRPGWLMRHPGGEHLIGTLLPEPAWEGVPHDARMPEFELKRPDFEALRDHLA